MLLRAGRRSPRRRECIDFDWKFTTAAQSGAEQPTFDDSAWQQVDLPHDWSIYGPFDPNAPSGRPGAFLPTGVGWYRKVIKIPDADKGRQISLEFDGAYEYAEVWFNGQMPRAAGRPSPATIQGFNMPNLISLEARQGDLQIQKLIYFLYGDTAYFSEDTFSVDLYLSFFAPDTDDRIVVVPEEEDRDIEILEEYRAMLVAPARIGYP